jgi:hypothetical protein
LHYSLLQMNTIILDNTYSANISTKFSFFTSFLKTCFCKLIFRYFQQP